MEITEISSTNEITCPYCGHENNDSWEVGTEVNEGDLDIQECGNCDKYFTANRNLTITYNSHPAPCLNGDSEHDWEPIIGLPKEYFKDKVRCSICGTERMEEKP